MIMVKVICEECLYTGKKVEFVKNSDYCKECVCDHPMCPKCKSAYHTVTITEWNNEKIWKNTYSIYFRNL